MSQQDKGFGSSIPSVAPRKRKCGRPHKKESVVPGESMAVTSDRVLNVNQTSKETDDCNDVKVGHVVTGVIEATCDGGFLIKVQLAGSETCLRGVAFVSEPIALVTSEAAHNQQAQLYYSVAPSGQRSKQSAKLQSQLPSCDNQVFLAKQESLDSLSASVIAPRVDLSKNSTSIYRKGILQGISKWGHESQPASAMSELSCGCTIEKDEANNSRPKFLLPDRELETEQHAVHHVHKLNEWTNDNPQNSNMELNQPLISADPESVPSEQSSRSRFKIQYGRRKRAFDT